MLIIQLFGKIIIKWKKKFRIKFIPFYLFTIRFAGFSPLIISSCNSTDGDIRVIYLNNTVDVDAFLNPLALLLCYYTLAIASGFILDGKVC